MIAVIVTIAKKWFVCILGFSTGQYFPVGICAWLNHSNLSTDPVNMRFLYFHSAVSVNSKLGVEWKC